jgi:hypothetical protein
MTLRQLNTFVYTLALIHIRMTPRILFFVVVVVLVVLMFDLRVCHLLGKCSYHLNYSAQN